VFKAETAIVESASDREEEQEGQPTLVHFGGLEFRVGTGNPDDHTAEQDINHSSRPLLRLLRGRYMVLIARVFAPPCNY
jgi:hypothetical protein